MPAKAVSFANGQTVSAMKKTSKSTKQVEQRNNNYLQQVSFTIARTNSKLNMKSLHNISGNISVQFGVF